LDGTVKRIEEENGNVRREKAVLEERANRKATAKRKKPESR